MTELRNTTCPVTGQPCIMGCFKDLFSKPENESNCFHADTDAPWDKAVATEGGGSYRFNGPTNCYVLAHKAGIRAALGQQLDSEDCVRGLIYFASSSEVMKSIRDYGSGPPQDESH